MPAVAPELPVTHSSREDNNFVIYDDVPVWVEHYSSHVGQHFTADDLNRIADRCNERIDDTGDLAMITLGHTKDDPNATPPPVVGLAGPFRVGRFGKKNPKAAIFATLRCFKSERNRVRQHPRLSVEYTYTKDDPKGGHFDVISLLGAEAPAMNLGVRYAMGRQGQSNTRTLRYSATTLAVPGGATPSHDSQRSSLSQVDIAQIIQACKPSIEECVRRLATPPPPPAVQAEDLDDDDQGQLSAETIRRKELSRAGAPNTQPKEENEMSTATATARSSAAHSGGRDEDQRAFYRKIGAIAQKNAGHKQFQIPEGSQSNAFIEAGTKRPAASFPSPQQAAQSQRSKVFVLAGTEGNWQGQSACDAMAAERSAAQKLRADLQKRYTACMDRAQRQANEQIIKGAWDPRNYSANLKAEIRREFSDAELQMLGVPGR